MRVDGRLDDFMQRSSLDHRCENARSIRNDLRVLRDRVEPEPNGIAGIVTRTGEKIWNETMAKAGAIGEDQMASFLITTGQEQKTTESDESIAAPVTPDAFSRERETFGTFLPIERTYAKFGKPAAIEGNGGSRWMSS